MCLMRVRLKTMLHWYIWAFFQGLQPVRSLCTRGEVTHDERRLVALHLQRDVAPAAIAQPPLRAGLRRPEGDDALVALNFARRDRDIIGRAGRRTNAGEHQYQGSDEPRGGPVKQGVSH